MPVTIHNNTTVDQFIVKMPGALLDAAYVFYNTDLIGGYGEPEGRGVPCSRYEFRGQREQPKVRTEFIPEAFAVINDTLKPPLPGFCQLKLHLQNKVSQLCHCMRTTRSQP